jgi:tRNA A58 N-methylase Trm61
MRFWHIEGMSVVRPEYRMVAHTGFITVARRLAEKA